MSNTECQSLVVHDAVVEKVKKTTPSTDELADLADFFKIFGDVTRMKILFALFVSELCVCDISVLIDASQSAVSHQLKTLRQAKLVKFRREGKTVFYSLKDDHVRLILSMGMEHIKE